MLSEFFLTGRSAARARAAQRAEGGAPPVPAPAAATRWTPFERIVRRGPTVGDGDLNGTAPDAVDLAAKPAMKPALSAASEAERLKRLRASFEDDLAHFLRAASTPAAE
jgi:hypothetical protein